MRIDDPRFRPDCTLQVDGQAVPARTGESVASALLAADRPLLSRSAKYHRPRGPFCLSGTCGSCLVRVDGQPNRRACRTPSREGLVVETQNGWPTARRDLLGIIDPLTPGGLDVHHLLTWPLPLNRALVAFTRRLAGFGTLPARPAGPGPEPSIETWDALVLGAGPAGLAAAEALALGDRRVLLVERDGVPGGRLRTRLEPDAAPERWPAEVARTVARAGGEVALRTTATGLWHEGGGPLCLLTGEDPPRTRLVRAGRIVVCTGGNARPPVFDGADRPGVLSGRALALALAEHGVLPGRRVAVLGSGPEADAIAGAFRSAGIEAPRVESPVAAAAGRGRLRALVLEDGTRVPCDAAAQGDPPAPAPDLLRVLGVGVDWDPSIEAFAPRVAPAGTTSVGGLLAAGEVARPVSAAEAIVRGRLAGEVARG